MLFEYLDVDECIANDYPCDPNASCENNIGSYTCECNDAYVGNGHECKGLY